jgi:hypothetical protein
VLGLEAVGSDTKSAFKKIDPGADAKADVTNYSAFPNSSFRVYPAQ